ncbi:hypothetical protein AB835_13555 [Candidatus Endobugula sertula]|uniref:Uncharacterized protein n=1 Tax=Candidatus Endobugula sertula TaxID=62101 RepID=A0A1D2QLT8_9GAMM|nr:hypothetical protein AB835_13555 [Candidatus Endobugula sertula]
MVINDPKGEVFNGTSAYLKQCGYKVIVIDPANLSHSSYFNPLEEAKSDIELEQVAEILVRAGIPSGGGKDDFWLQGAIRFASLFIKCLKNAGAEKSSPALSPLLLGMGWAISPRISVILHASGEFSLSCCSQ